MTFLILALIGVIWVVLANSGSGFALDLSGSVSSSLDSSSADPSSSGADSGVVADPSASPSWLGSLITQTDAIANSIFQAADSGASALGLGSSNIFVSIANAIQVFEGWKAGPPPSKSYRNNNPGNLRYSSWEAAYNCTGQDSTGFAIFPTYQDGFNALVHLLQTRATQNPGWTIFDLFNSYAPSSDNNNPTQYASFVAGHVGIDPNTTLGSLA